MDMLRFYAFLVLVNSFAIRRIQKKHRVELQNLSGIQELKSVKKLRPFLVFACIATFALLLPVGIASWVYGQLFILTLLYNIFSMLLILLLVFLSGIYGVRLMKVMRKIYKSTKINRFKVFLKKV